ncbi:MAG: hypothetical protein QGG42_03970 [Phycisphaerae bacterium]|jgi:hypothetical protein|nr:hypothetical protein [Phycisphaerae bacterium]
MNLKNAPLAIVPLLMVCLGSAVQAEVPFKKIVYPASPSNPELMAAKEIRRYIYLRTGNLLGVSQGDKIPQDSSNYIVVGRKDRAIIKDALSDTKRLSGSQALKAEEYLLASAPKGGRTLTVVTGGDNFGTLYGAYGLCEKLGVRFYLHGDVIPDASFTDWTAIKRLNESQRPHFKIRGLNPWGSHPQGIDIWRVDDWKSVISQLAKLKMNFVGIHGYPEFWQMDQQEPTVWVGFPEDVNPDGTVKAAPPSRFFNTQLPIQWGMAGPKNTSKYHFGSAMIYDKDDWGNVLTQGLTPFPKTPADSVKVFNKAGEYYKRVFTYAKSMGLKTATGTTTPLMLPKSVLSRMKELGYKHKYDTDIHVHKGHTRYNVDPKLTAKIYEGIFKRIINTHPLDYYWFWTDESWRFKPNLVGETVKDMQIGVKTGKAMKVPFKFASTGWIVGPKGDGTLFDREMPKDFIMSSIGMKFISEPIEPEYAKMPGRERWPIVWLTKWDHVNQTQFWVKNMKRAADDARKYKTQGLIGLTWKTRNIAPNIAALAQLQWRSEGWTVPAFYRDWALHQFGKEAAPQIAELLSDNDGKDPLQGGWAVWNGPPGGPGRLQDNVAKWTLPEQMAKLRPLIEGKGNLDRFDYWLNGLRYTKAYGQVKTDHSKVAEAYRLMLENASTRGDMGSFANWEQLIFPRNKIDESSMSMKYEGKARIFVPTVRANLDSGEALSLEVIILDKGTPRNMALHLRPMGTGAFQKKPLTHVARGVYGVKLPAAEQDMEYYIKATSSTGADMYFPPAAPKINQTLVVSPAYDAARAEK